MPKSALSVWTYRPHSFPAVPSWGDRRLRVLAIRRLLLCVSASLGGAGRLKRLLKIGNNVVNVLNAHRDADQVLQGDHRQSM